MSTCIMTGIFSGSSVVQARIPVDFPAVENAKNAVALGLKRSRISVFAVLANCDKARIANRREHPQMICSLVAKRMWMDSGAKVILRDPEILGGIPVFREHACVSRTYSITSKAAALWANS